MYPSDTRYFYSPVLGHVQGFSAVNANDVLSLQLEPGRYLLYIVSASATAGLVWVKQGTFGTVAVDGGASPTFPALPMSQDSLKMIELTVRPGIYASGLQQASKSDGLAVRAASGVTASLALLKQSRDRG